MLTINSQIIENEIVYEVLADNTLIVVDYLGSATEVVVPEIVEGKTVTEIGESAFEDTISLEKIDLPDTILVIGKRAFKGCSNLSSMY